MSLCDFIAEESEAELRWNLYRLAAPTTTAQPVLHGGSTVPDEDDDDPFYLSPEELAQRASMNPMERAGWKI